ncbi:hypothetical protein ACVWYF_003730 [Hymenobacter sp. UYAg731]
MKRYLPIGFVVLGLAGCSKATPDPTPKPTPYTVSWTENGSETTTQSYLTGTGGSGQIPAQTVRVGGRIYESGSIRTDIQLEVPAAVGTYPFGPASPAWATFESGSGRYYAGTAPGLTTAVGSGSITVTEFTGHSISGTFTFTGINSNTNTTKTITNGKFYVPE